MQLAGDRRRFFAQEGLIILNTPSIPLISNFFGFLFLTHAAAALSRRAQLVAHVLYRKMALAVLVPGLSSMYAAVLIMEARRLICNCLILGIVDRSCSAVYRLPSKVIAPVSSLAWYKELN